MAYLVATKRGKSRFVWVDRWTRWVAIQTGTVGVDATPTLIELDDEDAATERVEREVARAMKAGFAAAKLPGKPARVAKGDRLMFFGLGKGIHARSGLAIPRDVSDAVRAEPDSDAAWEKLATWMHKHAVPLRPLLESAQIDLAQLTPEQSRLLFLDLAKITPTIKASKWRAAHVVEATLAPYESNSPAAAAAACGDAPAFAFLHTLEIVGIGGSMLNNLVSLAPRLRRLVLTVTDKIPNNWFARCRQLRSLSLYIWGTEFNTVDSFAQLETLVLHSWPTKVLSCPFPNVTSLTLDVRHLGVDANLLAATLGTIDTNFPSLTTLSPFVQAGWSPTQQCAVVLDVLARSRLLPRLERVILQSGEDLEAIDAERRKTWRGGAFAHLAELELAAINGRLIAS